MNKALMTLYEKMDNAHLSEKGYEGVELTALLVAMALVNECVEAGILQPGPNWTKSDD